MYIYILAKQPPSAAFPSPSGGAPPSAPIWETAAVDGVSANKKLKNWGASGDTSGTASSAVKKIKDKFWGAYGAANALHTSA